MQCRWRASSAAAAISSVAVQVADHKHGNLSQRNARRGFRFYLRRGRAEQSHAGKSRSVAGSPAFGHADGSQRFPRQPLPGRLRGGLDPHLLGLKTDVLQVDFLLQSHRSTAHPRLCRAKGRQYLLPMLDAVPLHVTPGQCSHHSSD